MEESGDPWAVLGDPDRVELSGIIHSSTRGLSGTEAQTLGGVLWIQEGTKEKQTLSSWYMLPTEEDRR